MTGRPRDRYRQRPGRGWLVDHDQQRSVLGELVEQRPQLRLGVGQRRVVQPFPVRVQADRVMGIFADVQAKEDPAQLLDQELRKR